jgi:hypothetical protein
MFPYYIELLCNVADVLLEMVGWDWMGLESSVTICWGVILLLFFPVDGVFSHVAS